MQGGAYDDYCNANLPADYYYDPDQQYHNNDNSNQQFIDRCIFPHSIFTCCELNLKLHYLLIPGIPGRPIGTGQITTTMKRAIFWGTSLSIAS